MRGRPRQAGKWAASPPPSPSEGRVSGDGFQLSLTRCRCWQEAQGTEVGSLAPCLPGPSLCSTAGTCLLSAARRHLCPRNQDRVWAERESQPSSQHGDGQQAQTGCGPRAQPPSGGLRLSWCRLPAPRSPLRPRGPDPEHLQAPQDPHLHLLEWWESGVLHHRAGGDAKGIGGAEQVGGNGRAPRFLLRQWGLHDEAFSTAAAAPRASVLGARAEGQGWGGVGEGGPPTRTSRSSCSLTGSGCSRNVLSLRFSTQICGTVALEVEGEETRVPERDRSARKRPWEGLLGAQRAPRVHEGTQQRAGAPYPAWTPTYIQHAFPTRPHLL